MEKGDFIQFLLNGGHKNVNLFRWLAFAFCFSLSTPRMYYFSASDTFFIVELKSTYKTGAHCGDKTCRKWPVGHYPGHVCNMRVTEPPHCITVLLFSALSWNFFFVFMNNFFLCVSVAVCEIMPGNSSRNHTYIRKEAINNNKFSARSRSKNEHEPLKAWRRLGKWKDTIQAQGAAKDIAASAAIARHHVMF